MAVSLKEIGEIEKLPYEIKQFEWRIADFILVSENENSLLYRSPEFSLTDDDVLWGLKMFTRRNNPMSLALFNSKKRDYSLEYYFGLKNSNNFVEQFFSGTLKESPGTPWIEFIKWPDLMQRKSELLPNNTLTIVCTMKYRTEIGDSAQPIIVDETNPLKLIKLDKLSEDFKELFANKETCDVTLKIKEKEYKAHKSVLIARSNVLAAFFKHDTLEKQSGVITISDCDPDSFQEFLEYLYCGKLEDLSFRSALNLYYTSDKYDVLELKTFCIEYLMRSLTVENMCEVVVFADRYDETELLTAVQDFFNNKASEIFVTSHWDSLMKNKSRLAKKLLIEMSKVKL